jgi:DNA-binding protein H-NS
MAINLEKLSLDELKDLKMDVELAIRGFEKRRKKEALSPRKRLRRSTGFRSMRSLARNPDPRACRNTPTRRTRTRPGRAAAGSPGWVKEALGKGKSLDDLAI